jgi:hypothetical protein
MMYAILYKPFSDFLVFDVLVMKKRSPGGIMRWELEAVQTQLTSDSVTSGVNWRLMANSGALRGTLWMHLCSCNNGGL